MLFFIVIKYIFYSITKIRKSILEFIKNFMKLIDETFFIDKFEEPKRIEGIEKN